MRDTHAELERGDAMSEYARAPMRPSWGGVHHLFTQATLAQRQPHRSQEHSRCCSHSWRASGARTDRGSTSSTGYRSCTEPTLLERRIAIKSQQSLASSSPRRRSALAPDYQHPPLTTMVRSPIMATRRRWIALRTMNRCVHIWPQQRRRERNGFGMVGIDLGRLQHGQRA